MRVVFDGMCSDIVAWSFIVPPESDSHQELREQCCRNTMTWVLDRLEAGSSDAEILAENAVKAREAIGAGLSELRAETALAVAERMCRNAIVCMKNIAMIP